jgi:hypothetical protein
VEEGCTPGLQRAERVLRISSILYVSMDWLIGEVSRHQSVGGSIDKHNHVVFQLHSELESR